MLQLLVQVTDIARFFRTFCNGGQLRFRFWLIALACAALLAAAGGGWALWQGWQDGQSGQDAAGKDKPDLGLFTSLPIVWAEASSVRDMLADPAPPHWARVALERRFRLIPLDVLKPSRAMRYLLVAQPRALAPEENVALDQWVRDGGRLLLFADPLLTWESAFAVGDKRRPQDIVLLSPILARWGLALRIDEDQPGRERELAGIPVRFAGTLVPTGQGHDAACAITGEGLIAHCGIGRGRVTIVADAAVLEPADDPALREAALERLIEQAFAS